MTAHTPLKSNGITATQIIVESLFAVLALGAIVVFGLRHASVLDPEFQNLALLLDYFVCFLFGAKALWDLGRAPDKLRWLKWGWADFAASIPEIEAFRGLRLLRLLLMFRLLRPCRGTTRMVLSHRAIVYSLQKPLPLIPKHRCGRGINGFADTCSGLTPLHGPTA